jgi:hypothetical protein
MHNWFAALLLSELRSLVENHYCEHSELSGSESVKRSFMECGRCFGTYKFIGDTYECGNCNLVIGRDINAARLMYLLTFINMLINAP